MNSIRRMPSCMHGGTWGFQIGRAFETTLYSIFNCENKFARKKKLKHLKMNFCQHYFVIHGYADLRMKIQTGNIPGQKLLTTYLTTYPFGKPLTLVSNVMQGKFFLIKSSLNIPAISEGKAESRPY